MSTLSRTPFIGLTFAAVIAVSVLLFGGIARADAWGGQGGWGGSGWNHGFFGRDHDFDDFHHNFFDRDDFFHHHNFFNRDFDRDDFHHHNHWGWGGNGWGW